MTFSSDIIKKTSKVRYFSIVRSSLASVHTAVWEVATWRLPFGGSQLIGALYMTEASNELDCIDICKYNN